MPISSFLRRKLLPQFQSGHTRYVECVKEVFRDGCRWLDAGGGRRIFPDAYDGEQSLVARASQVVVCDADPESLEDHRSVSERVCCTLSNVPFQDSSFDLITCGMVVEHLDNPAPCLKELGRLLAPGGTLVIHTVNYYGYATIVAQLSKCLPFRRWIIAQITGRKEEDIFPTFYRCNTAAVLSRYLKNAKLKIVELAHTDAGILFDRIWPLALLECLYIQLTRWKALSKLRGQLLVVATKMPE
jgi:ubiquinone/menaquinone biosynthesis C-methylase UbiE